MTVPIIAAIALFAMAVLFIAISCNALVALRNRVLNAFSQIDVQLRRRYDLIPNLVETVKGYMAHERQTLEAVVQARARAVGALAAASSAPADAMLFGQFVGAESALVGALGRFRLLAEAYPDLRADRNSVLLMEELASTENRVAFARQAYNDQVLAYNTRRQSFPINLVSAIFGFRAASLFEIDASQRDAVRVSLEPASPIAANSAPPVA